MQNFSSRPYYIKELYIQIIIFFIVSFVFLLGIFFARKKIELLVQKLELSSAQIQAQNLKIESHTRLKNDFIVAENYKKNLRSFLINEDDIYSFPQKIYKIGLDYGVEAKMTLSQSEENNLNSNILPYFNFIINIDGERANVLNFSKFIEEGDIFISLKSFNIRESDSIINAKMDGRIYYSKNN